MAAVPSEGRAAAASTRLIQPEGEATRLLYERHQRKILSFCHHQLGNREEAEDATQITFMNAFRGLSRGMSPEFETAWLFKIAHNVCLTKQRNTYRRRLVEVTSDFELIEERVPAHEGDSDELFGLTNALRALPEQQRRALLLREWQGLSYKEIADEMRLSQSATETLIFRARRSLAEGLTSDPAVKRGRGRPRASADMGALAATLKSLLLGGGVKVAATVATVAATSVVASTPTARQDFFKVVIHPLTPTHKPMAKHAVPILKPVVRAMHVSAPFVPVISHTVAKPLPAAHVKVAAPAVVAAVSATAAPDPTPVVVHPAAAPKVAAQVPVAPVVTPTPAPAPAAPPPAAPVESAPSSAEAAAPAASAAPATVDTSTQTRTTASASPSASAPGQLKKDAAAQATPVTTTPTVTTPAISSPTPVDPGSLPAATTVTLPPGHAKKADDGQSWVPPKQAKKDQNTAVILPPTPAAITAVVTTTETPSVTTTVVVPDPTPVASLPPDQAKKADDGDPGDGYGRGKGKNKN